MGRPPSIRTWFSPLVLLAVLTSGFCLATGSSASAADPNRAQSSPVISGAASPAAYPLIADVAIQPNGILWGRIVDAQRGAATEAVAGLPISFLRGEQLVGRAITDPSGRFAVPNLTTGIYRVVVERPQVPSGHFCRVWSSTAAPPHASPELTLPLEPVVVRGRSALWVAWPPSFTTTVIAAGAVAAPIVYHNVHQDNKAPISP